MLFLDFKLKLMNKISQALIVLGSCFSANLSLAQPENDACSNAIQLCPNSTISATTTDATSDGATDNSFCFSPNATIWFYFTTDSDGGDVSIDLTNLSFNPDPTFGQQIDALILDVTTPCASASYTPYSACGSGSTDFTINNAVALAGSTTYYVQVNGRLVGGGVTYPAACDFDISISGTAVDKPTPTVSISALVTDLCQGDDEVITANISDCSDTTNYQWLYNGSLIYSSSSYYFSTDQLTTSGDLTLVITCDTDCPQSDTSNAITYNITEIEANAGPDKFIEQGGQVALEGSGTGDPLWSPSTSLTNPAVFEPIANPESTTTYFLTVTSGSCVKTDSVNVFVGELITIYSAFTPNGDNINDKWIITNSSSYPNIEVTVYDRSGQVVFNTTNYSTQEKWWDGTFKGKDLPSSTYFYVIELNDGDNNVFKGQVTIIR